MFDFDDGEKCLCCYKKKDFNTGQKSAGTQEHETKIQTAIAFLKAADK